MGRTLTKNYEPLKQWAIVLAGLKMTRPEISKCLNVPEGTVKYWLWKEKIVNQYIPIVNQNGKIVCNSGATVDNFYEGLPPNPTPELFVGLAESLNFIEKDSIDIIITSPPYNLGQEKWPMGGNGRTARDTGIGYSLHEDDMPESEYQAWQIKCLEEWYRVAKPGASLFYNHKVRQREGEVIHPIVWLQGTSKWLLRQEIVWDRKSTHNHSATLFWPQDERIFWLTKGKPNLSDKSIGRPSVWQEFGPIPKTGDHPAPFTPALPKMILEAAGKPGDVILDPFGGGMTTCFVASAMGYRSIGVDKDEGYVKLAAGKLGIAYERGT